MTFKPITISLDSPITHGEEEITELKFERKMTVADLRGMNVSGMTHEDLYTLVGRLSGYPPSAMAKLSIPDYMKAVEVVGDFFGGSPLTGEKE